MIVRITAGFALAALVSLLARRAGSLSTSGAVAAALTGTVCVAAGWGWGALLVIYFVSSVLLSRAGAATKATRTAAIVEKGGQRDAVQVLANGGLFALLALLAWLLPPGALAACAAVGAVGALGAAAADTWATEVGTLASATPRSLLGLRRVPPGTSGGISAPGTLALGAGALFVALVARALGLTTAVGAVTLGGIAGAFADSLLGATVQERRWCSVCERKTERLVHPCGTRTSRASGLAWLNNDAVNVGATLAGALVAAAIA